MAKRKVAALSSIAASHCTLTKMALVIDNGGGSVKAGSDSSKEPLVLANMTARVSKSMQYLVSNQIYECRDGSSLNFIRPCDRGYLNNWQCEIDVWSYMFGLPQFQGLSPQDTSLVLTEPQVNPTTLQNDTNEVIFEYFGFKDYARKPAQWFSMYEYCQDREWNKNALNSCVVVDSGFSFTHAVPFINRSCRRHAVCTHFTELAQLFRLNCLFIDSVLLCCVVLSPVTQMKRLNIGGKLLTNYLKELVSYRQWNMMDEYLLMNQVRINTA
jgi:actin-related protein 6